MKIILYCLNYKPEIVGVGKYNGELVDFLHDKSNQLRVITAPKYYPEWNVKENKYLCENNGIAKVYRCPIYVPKLPNGIKRLLHLISFSISSFPILLKQLIWKPDCLIMVAPTLFCAPNVFIFKFFSFKKVFTMIHIQDLEIDAAFSLRLLKGKFFKNILFKIEKLIYKNFEVVGTISQGMINKLEEKGINKNKIYYLPNWIDTKKFKQKNESNRLTNTYRQKFNLSPETIVIQYSGTINKKQGFNFIIPIIENFKNNKNVFWIFGGEGPTKKQLIYSTRKIKNIKFLPFQDANKMSDWLNFGDIHIIPQDEKVEDLLFPSKLLAILATGNPIISNCSPKSDLGKIIQDVGLRVNPKDQIRFIEAINYLIYNPDKRYLLGKKGRTIVEEKFNKKFVLEKFHNFLKRNLNIF